MAQQPDYVLPFNNLIQYVPKNLRNSVVTGLLDNLFNRFMTRDESVPLYGYIGKKPSAEEDKSPKITQLTVERDINAITPVLNFKVGSEHIPFTFQDILKKAERLGIDANSQNWLYSQGNNFKPPVDFDKFVNFYKYYWIGKAIDAIPEMEWNPELLPEYYVIKKPALTDLVKLNVRVSSGPLDSYVLTGSGFLDQSFTVQFLDAYNFTITPSAALQGPGGLYSPIPASYNLPILPTGIVNPADDERPFSYQVTGPQGTFTLLEFKITREPTFDSFGTHDGWTSYVAADTIAIDTTFLTDAYSLNFSGSLGIKPKISGVQALDVFQTIDGVQLREGDRVLIQAPAPISGIYIVSKQVWTRAPDFDTDTWSIGARTFTELGTLYGGKVWESLGAPSAWGWIDTGLTESLTNDWQEGNLWLKGSEVDALGIPRSNIIQATRPIIEYYADVQLNSRVVDGVAQDSELLGSNYKQEKSEFNQLPLFDLFTYDNHHSGLVSSIFYYEEDPTAEVDVALQRRIRRSTNESADFIFNHGCVDNDQRILFFKQDNLLKTIWLAGYNSPSTVDVTFNGSGDGAITTVTPSEFTQQQIWTLTATGPTTFDISGSKMVELPVPFNQVVVGIAYDNGEISFTINAGITPFSAGDTFIIRIANLERPRYVFRNEDSVVNDLFGGYAGDINGIGAWQSSRTFINNPYNESRAEIAEGSIYSHFRSILGNQVEGRPTDYAFGGNIKLWSEQHTLLASLLMQKDLTPVSVIDLAQRLYDNALNAVRDIYMQKIVEYFSTNETVTSDGTPAGTAKVESLLEYVLQLRSLDHQVRTVMFDTTAGVLGFPITLPSLGILEPVVPTYMFDPVLGSTLFIHHDGHATVPFVNDETFKQQIFGAYAGKNILRSDGTETPAVGSFSATPPPVPYKGEFWLPPTGEVYSFAVDFDTEATPDASVAGTVWFKRSSSQLYISNGITWDLQPTHITYWTQVDLAATLNEMLLLVEQRLYGDINQNQRRYDFSAIVTNQSFQEQLRRELFTFAAVNGLDPLGTNYDATDPFTWNYSQSIAFAPVTTPTVPARWYNAMMAHQQTFVGIIPTERPNLEPWKLFGFSTFSAWWSSLTPLQQVAYTPFATPDDLLDGTFINGGSVRAVETNTSASTTLFGLTTIDDVALSSGDVVLLTSEVLPQNNGAWIVSPGPWARTAAPLAFKTFFNVEQGNSQAGTVWALTGTVAAVGTDPVNIAQVRAWSTEMWVDILAIYPTLRLSVNPWTDALLPPYIKQWFIEPTIAPATPGVTNQIASFALTNSIPPGVAAPYQFGEGSPVEEVWSRSIDYGYSKAKALFRFDPLAFLGFCWGFNWVEVDGILYDGYDLNMPRHQYFKLHGEPLKSIDRTTAFNFTSVTGTSAVDLTIQYDAYDINRRQNFSVRTADGTIIGYVQEGLSNIFSASGITMLSSSFFIEDKGYPFKMGDKVRVTANADGTNLQVVFTPAIYHQIYGFGQIFTNSLREISTDTTTSYAINAFREWDVNMGHRAGGLIATDDLKIFTETSTLSPASYSLLFKKNDGMKSIWLQGLRITVQQYGTVAIQNGFQMNYPAGDGSDWSFRIEGYNPRFLDITYYTFSPTSARQTFYALDQSATNLAWTQPLEKNATVTTQLPQTITGIQNVLDFLFGYAQYTEDQGWEFTYIDGTNIDAETGRNRDWQLEFEKFVDRVYRGIDPGQGVIVNPFIDQVQVKQSSGLLGTFGNEVLFDIYSHAAVFDINGSKLSKNDVFVSRTNQKSHIDAVSPMFSIHALIDEFEHLFVFENYVDPSESNGVLYDPFSGARTVTYKFNGRKQIGGTLRPEFGGYYLVGNEVKQNLQASTDNLAALYDANEVFENTKTTKNALALLGFNTKDYFTSLDITDRSQFNFWRGLIQSKGTNMSIDAYLNNNRFKDAKLDEYWAYKIAEYGDARQKTFPELRVQVQDCLQQFTQLQFDAAVELPNFTQITRFDEHRWFTIDDLNQDTFFKAEPVGSFSKTVTMNEIVQLPFIADALIISGSVTQLNAASLLATANGTITITGYGAATPRYNPIKLFNYEDDELVEEIPLWHPATGKHSPVALESVNIISSENPAKYNYSTLLINNPAYDALRAWGDKEVGRIWFNTKNLFYVPYYDSFVFPNRAERLSRWGALADYATIDVYEWVKSAVPPSEYDALARIDAGNADIDDTVKASGQVALEELYARDRIYKIAPVAWSFSPVATDVDWGDRPPMKYSGDITNSVGLVVNGEFIFLDTGSFAQLGIISGDRVGTWQHGVSPGPLSEGVINDTFQQLLLDSSSGTSLAPIPTTVISSVGPDDFTCSVSVEAVSYPDTRFIGEIAVTQEQDVNQLTDIDGNLIALWDHNFYIRVTEVSTGEYSRFLAYTIRIAGSGSGTALDPFVQDPLVTSVTNGSIYDYTITELGLRFRVVSSTTGIVDGDFAVRAIGQAYGTNTLLIKDAVTVNWIIAAEDGQYTNDTTDTLYAYNNEIGWRVWNVPTQAELNSDGKQPSSSWKPYVGEAKEFYPTFDDLQEAVEYTENPLTLNDGTVVPRYLSDWTEWEKLQDIKVSRISATTADMLFNISEFDFSLTKFDVSRTAVYVNGIAQLKAAYEISGGELTVLNVQQGFTVDIIMRKYNPPASELGFNPDVEDDLSFRRQYKKDYEYVAQEVRDKDGNLNTIYYYFWVKNKSTVATGKKMSVQAITDNLRTGPVNFLTFQNILPAQTVPTILPWRYDAITISGLSYVVTKDDTFKLRFTRNFTLRDDPNELDLKNTHTEWGLIRPAQKSKIPEKLWLKLVDSMAGLDAALNPVPSLRRVLYDERNGTTTRYGFGNEQTLAPSNLLRSSVSYTIVNTKQTEETMTEIVPDYIEFIDAVVDIASTDEYDNPIEKQEAKKTKALQVEQVFFSTSAQIRSTMTDIWTSASVAQINEIFFAALEDILASNFELTDIFKTSRLSIYSIQEKRAGNVVPTYE